MKSERQTRQDKIDLQLGRAGWSSGSRQLISELLVEKPSAIRNEPDTFRAQNEFVDYALFDRLGRLLAIVEAKRSSRDPLVGEPLPSRLFRLRLEKLQILAGRADAPSIAHTIHQLRDLVGTLPLENINVAPHAEEIRTLSGSDEPWRGLNDERISQLMFVRTLRKAVMQKAEVTSLDALRQPPFSTIGDPEHLFKKPELDDLFDLIHSVAA